MLHARERSKAIDISPSMCLNLYIYILVKFEYQVIAVKMYIYNIIFT